MRKLFVLLWVAGCGTEIDPAGLPSIEGYKSWAHKDPITSAIPGHGDSVRTIYMNDVARAYPHGGRYPLGTVLVKEIAGKDGSLRYTAVMRKVGDDADVPTDEGWLFTSFGSDGAEKQYDLCWQTCHKAGPWDGSWFDYGE